VSEDCSGVGVEDTSVSDGEESDPPQPTTMRALITTIPQTKLANLFMISIPRLAVE
jgi:hypothetical protein